MITRGEALLFWQFKAKDGAEQIKKVGHYLKKTIFRLVTYCHRDNQRSVQKARWVVGPNEQSSVVAFKQRAYVLPPQAVSISTLSPACKVTPLAN